MRFKKILFLILPLLLVSCGNIKVVDYNPSKESSDKQFDFEGNYTPPELTIDGIKDDEQWQNASNEIVFGSTNQTTMIIYRGENALFCFFEVEDNDIQTVGNNNGDDVTHGDSVEVYFDFANDAALKPLTDDIQINIGAHGKTRIFVGANGSWGSWNGLLDYEIKLDGTLNDSSDTDNGYNVELMIPYSQVGIDKNSIFGVSVGHVARGKDSTSETLQYTWGGLVYEGSFIDPQVPKGYLVSMGNTIYSKANMPIGNISLSGYIYDELGQKVSQAKVMAGDNIVYTNDYGKYEFSSIDAELFDSLVVSKDSYITYEKEITIQELKTDSGKVNIDLCLISTSSNKKVTINGVVKNPASGCVNGALITIGSQTAYSNEQGEFSIECLLSYDLEVLISKEGYKDTVTYLDTLALIHENNYDADVLSLSSPSSTTVFAGTKGIPEVEVEIYRGFDGIHFLFKSSQNIINGDHIEVFIDAGSSFNGRDTSDYRIDFTGDGSISIVNFGNGTNTVVSTSGIKNNAYLEGVTYYYDTMIPYEFLGVTSSDVIGVSFGVWSQSLNDWDGWHYPGNGFDAYVAPEYADMYCRIGLDNGLYRASSNKVETIRVYGNVVDELGNNVTTATINDVNVNSDGSYSMYFIKGDTVELNVRATGYITRTITLSKEEIASGIVNLDIKLASAIATITGTCNVNGAKVYLEGDPSIFTYVVDGSYSLNVPTSKNAYIIFEYDGYKTHRFGVGVTTLIQSASNSTPYVRNVTMEAN